MEKLLYYPYINVPRTDWTLRTLLYYDTIGSIVPQEYFYNPEEHYDSFMLKLVKDELVIPIDPLRTITHPWEVTQPLLTFFRSPEFDELQARQNFEYGLVNRINRQKFEGVGSRIHSEKFDGEIFYQLEIMGLARRMEGNWYSVETTTAGYLMTFLATVIGSKLDMRPTTDILDQSQNENIASNDTKRTIILRELIPFPQEIEIKKLRRFKDKYSESLKLFKNKVEQIVLNPTIETNSDLFKEHILELKIRRDELTAKMGENKLGRVFFGTFCGIAGALYGLLTASTTGVVIGGLPGFASAVYSALQIEKPENIIDQSGMKYLALIDRKIKKN
jgi:hypothetical protein